MCLPRLVQYRTTLLTLLSNLQRIITSGVDEPIWLLGWNNLFSVASPFHLMNARGQAISGKLRPPKGESILPVYHQECDSYRRQPPQEELAETDWLCPLFPRIFRQLFICCLVPAVCVLWRLLKTTFGLVGYSPSVSSLWLNWHRNKEVW